jgi:hypothetical protein
MDRVGSGGQGDVQALGPPAQAPPCVVGDLDAVLPRLRQAACGLVARQAHRLVYADRAVAAAAVGQVVHLVGKGLAAGREINR